MRPSFFAAVENLPSSTGAAAPLFQKEGKKTAHLPVLALADVVHAPHPGKPLRQLCPPVHEHRVRHDDQVRPKVLLPLGEVGDQRHDLYGLPEAHLVGQDAVELVVVKRDHPLQAHKLVVAERGARGGPEAGGGRVDLLGDGVREGVVRGDHAAAAAFLPLLASLAASPGPRRRRRCPCRAVVEDEEEEGGREGGREGGMWRRRRRS